MIASVSLAISLGLDIINRVGPIPGNYAGEEQTRKYWMKDHFLPKVSDRLTYAEWARVGKRSSLDYAREKMEELL